MLLMVSAALMMAASPDGSAVASLSPEEEAAAEKMICRKKVVTGSRSKRERICMSKRQWDRLHANARNDVGRILDDANRHHTAEKMP
jgi:hypothetical protein